MAWKTTVYNVLEHDESYLQDEINELLDERFGNPAKALSACGSRLVISKGPFAYVISQWNSERTVVLAGPAARRGGEKGERGGT